MMKLFSKNSNLCDHNSPTLQTDRQTTCDRNTALCTKVHRAVKTSNALGVLVGREYEMLGNVLASICVFNMSLCGLTVIGWIVSVSTSTQPGRGVNGATTRCTGSLSIVVCKLATTEGHGNRDRRRPVAQCGFTLCIFVINYYGLFLIQSTLTF